jgi:hypothetical protein
MDGWSVFVNRPELQFLSMNKTAMAKPVIRTLVHEIFVLAACDY